MKVYTVMRARRVLTWSTASFELEANDLDEATISANEYADADLDWVAFAQEEDKVEQTIVELPTWQVIDLDRKEP